MLEPIDVLEALLFASDAPVELDRIQEVLDLESPAAARELIEAFRQRLEGRALQVVEAGGGFRLVTRPELAPWLVKLQRSKTRSRLSRPALETLAIVAYHQPVSRPQVDAIRGVNSEGVLDSLLDRRMVKIAGRKDSPGRPFLYETTRDFLVAFGLRDLGDLPKVEGELQMPAMAEGGAEAATTEEELVAASISGDDPIGTEAAEGDLIESARIGDDLVEATRAEDDLVEASTIERGLVDVDAEPGPEGSRPSAPDGAEAARDQSTAEASQDGMRTLASLEGAVVAGEMPAESGEGSSAVDPPQQDPGPGGAGVAPRS